MKCPILPQVWLPPGEKGKWQQPDCLKEECAWYQKELENCIVYQAGMELGVLITFIEDLVSKMPHEEE